MPSDSPIPIPVRVKKVSEVRTLVFDFVDRVVTGDSLTGAATMTYPSGLTEVATSRTSNKILSRFSGGAEDVVYAVDCSCGTTNGDVLVLSVIIMIDSDVN